MGWGPGRGSGEPCSSNKPFASGTRSGTGGSPGAPPVPADARSGELRVELGGDWVDVSDGVSSCGGVTKRGCASRGR